MTCLLAAFVGGFTGTTAVIVGYRIRRARALRDLERAE